jgi:hypothetical protein
MTDSVPTGQSAGITNFASGKVDPTDGSSVLINLGFMPRYFKVFNEDRLEVHEKFEGMPTANTLKTINADTAQIVLDTGSDIVFNSDRTVTLSATLADTGDCLWYIAFG